MRSFIFSRSWLVLWAVVAALFVAGALNRQYNAAGLTDYEVGVTPGAFDLLAGAVEFGIAAVVCAAIAFAPAAWRTLQPAPPAQVPTHV